MAVLTMKPHYIQYQTINEGYVDDIGDFHSGEAYWDGHIECDAVPSTNGAQERVFEDGVSRAYAFTLYLHPNARKFSIGEKVRLNRQGEIYELEVKGSMPYQHQYKIWIG